jgi:hypothetical protein
MKAQRTRGGEKGEREEPEGAKRGKEEREARESLREQQSTTTMATGKERKRLREEE